MSALDKFQNYLRPTASDFSNLIDEVVNDAANDLNAKFFSEGVFLDGTVLIDSAGSVLHPHIDAWSSQILQCNTTVSAQMLLNTESPIDVDAANPSTQVIAGGGITGGGTLGDGTITLAVSPTGTAGTYAATSDFTVNKFGQIEAVATRDANVAYKCMTKTVASATIYSAYDTAEFRAAFTSAVELTFAYSFSVDSTNATIIMQLGTANGYWGTGYKSIAQEYHYSNANQIASGLALNHYSHMRTNGIASGIFKLRRYGYTYTGYGKGSFDTAASSPEETFTFVGYLVKDTPAVRFRITCNSSTHSLTGGSGCAYLIIA